MGTGLGAEWGERGSREGEGPRVPRGAGATTGEGGTGRDRAGGDDG
jgi:hypothetical protein